MNLEKLKQAIEVLGFTITHIAKRNANGPDMWIYRNGIPYSLEIKSTRRTKRGSLQVPPVEPKRRLDNFIAIKINDYFLIEPMEHHLKSCSTKGYRTMVGF